MTKYTLAFISPLSPQQTGIATYSEELLAYLSHYYIITTISTQKEAEIFKTNHTIYDRVLLHLGNSAFHTYMLDLLQTIPAVIVLHDFYLNNLFAHSKKLSRILLYKEHGYQALIDKKKDYPCNKTILNDAIGIITHSHYSQKLLSNFYSDIDFTNHTIIPLLREPSQSNNLFTKEQLNLPKDSFIVCSFGVLSPNKLNQDLLDAWKCSSLSSNPKNYLIFVGKQDNSTQTVKLTKQISKQNNIIITGWTDNKTFQSYLNIADLAVQLRTDSRGESSATLLDTMNHSIPTIANDNGSVSELPKETFFMLNDTFSLDDLRSALESLYNDKAKRQTLLKNAKNYITNTHDPKKCAKLYYETIEKSYKNQDIFKKNAIAKLSKTQNTKNLLYLLTLTQFENIKQKQIFLDISSIVKHDLKTGIQRVVRSQLLHLINIAPKNYRIEPVFLKDSTYYYANNYTINLLAKDKPKEIADYISGTILSQQPISLNKGDIFYGLDLNTKEVAQSKIHHIYENYKALGVKIYFLVYDLLPITNPLFFPSNMHQIHTQWLNHISTVADELICISHTVAHEVKLWLQTHKKQNTPKISTIHLGADIQKNISPLQEKYIKNPTFLMVGTIEPRKGHIQVLKTFELLYKQGININLIIVGKKGWKVDSDTQTFLTNIEAYKYLTYHESASDKFLTNLYNTCDAIIVASQAEGFGLPLIEAAQYSLPIIARDIPVFREIASTNAYYFPNTLDINPLASSIKEWLKLYQQNKHPKSSNIPYLTWQQNAKQTLDLLKGNKCTVL